MKIILLIMLLSLSQARLLYSKHINHVQEQAPFDENHLLINGFLSGMALDADINTLLPCLNDLVDLTKEVSEHIIEFKSDSAIGKMKAFKSMERALSKFPGIFKECASDLKNDYLRLVNSLHVLKKFKSFEYETGKKIEINGVNVIQDVKLLIENFNSKKWHNVGFSFGAILAKICGTGDVIN